MWGEATSHTQAPRQGPSSPISCFPLPTSRFPLPASASCLPEHTDPSTATRCHHVGPYDSRSPARKSQGWPLLTPRARAHASLLRPTCAVYTGCPPSARPRGCGRCGPWLAPLPPDGPEHGGPSGYTRPTQWALSSSCRVTRPLHVQTFPDFFSIVPCSGERPAHRAPTLTQTSQETSSVYTAPCT